MKFFVYSRAAIEMVRPHEVPHIIISITSAPTDLARLKASPACTGILRLSFPDAEEGSELFAEEVLFSRAQAEEIWAFVRAHLTGLERIVVHCDAGVSRSPAVAAALSRVLTGDDAEFFAGRYEPNERVYRMLLEVAATGSDGLRPRQ
jgi:predicted protein tyrosine phosphatase